MSKLELQQDHPVGTSTEPTNQPLPSGLKATSLTDNSARHEFAKDLNPFGDLRKKKKGEEFDLEAENFTAIKSVEQLVAAERALPEATPEAPSGLSVSQASVINQDLELARKLEGKTRSGDLVIDSTSSSKSTEQQEEALRQAREREARELARAQEEVRAKAELQAEQQKIQLQNAQLQQAQQEEKTMQEVKAMASNVAKAHFAEDPNRVISSAEFKTYMEQTIAKTNADPTLIAKIQEEFIKTYTAQRDADFNDMNWVKRKYYEAKNWCSGALDSLREVGNDLINAGESLLKGAKAVGVGIVTLGKGITNAIVNADWEKIGEKTLELAGKAWDAVKEPENWLKAGKMILDGGIYVVEGIAKGAWNLVTDPVGSLKAVGKFAGDMCDSIGLTAVAKGVVAGIKAPYEYIYDLARTGGDFSVANKNFANNMVALKDGVVGGLQCACEITGIADVYYAASHGCKALILVGEGRNLEAALEGAQATMHLTFAALSAGSIAATVASGGAAVGTVALVATGRIAAKEALQLMAKQGLKTIGKELAENALEQGLKNGAKTIAKEVAQESAQVLGKETVDLVIKEGAGVVTKETAGKITEKIAARAAELGEKNAKEILERSGIAKHLTEGAETTFKDLQTGGKELRQKLIDAGYSVKEAKQMSKATSKAFRSGVKDGEILETLTKEASEVIQKEIVPDASAHFGKAYRGHIDDALKDNPAFKESMDAIAHKAGKSTKEFSDELAEAATKAYREGLEKGIKEVCEQAFKKALAKFRLHSHAVMGEGRSRVRAPVDTELVIDEQYVSEVYAFSQKEEVVAHQAEAKNDPSADKRSRIIERDGNIIRVEFYTVEGNEIIIAQDIVGSLVEKVDPSKIIKHNFAGASENEDRRVA